MVLRLFAFPFRIEHEILSEAHPSIERPAFLGMIFHTSTDSKHQIQSYN